MSTLAARIAKHKLPTKTVLVYLSDHKWHTTQELISQTGVAKPIAHIRSLRIDGLVIDMQILQGGNGAPRQFLYRLVTPLEKAELNALSVKGVLLPAKSAPQDIVDTAKKKLPPLFKQNVLDALTDWDNQSRGWVKYDSSYQFDPELNDEDRAFAREQANKCRRALLDMGVRL